MHKNASHDHLPPFGLRDFINGQIFLPSIQTDNETEVVYFQEHKQNSLR
jgi:hypothetical protein